MKRLREGLRCGWPLLLLLLLAVGCGPSAQSQADEEREPYFLAGKSRVSSLDYPGAADSFEKALTVNPESAAAHFELGCLYEQHLGDPAQAIYHYESYLRLRPGADNGEVVKQRILSCKQELAKTVSLGPITEKQQQQIESLFEQNKKLTDENARLRQLLAQRRGGEAGGPAVAAAGQPSPSRSTTGPVARPAAERESSRTELAVPSDIPGPTRTHTVKPGETPLLIARHYGIKLQALMVANPRLEPRRMRVGETLTIPTR
jgi:tetratricopeptide (TPR) repeat protein